MTNLAEIVRARNTLLRAWAAWNDIKLDHYGTDEAVNAQRHMNHIADRLGDFTEADWGIIRNAQREYVHEGTS